MHQVPDSVSKQQGGASGLRSLQAQERLARFNTNVLLWLQWTPLASCPRPWTVSKSNRTLSGADHRGEIEAVP
jgi:hypothetical protein